MSRLLTIEFSVIFSGTSTMFQLTGVQLTTSLPLSLVVALVPLGATGFHARPNRCGRGDVRARLRIDLVDRGFIAF